ncbi:UDP-glucuronic acid decarboxylase 1 [Capsicum baccatum]|uniref:UDP-glucuronic acid decarboxylase 1 n=1 Tax=Capsicum baccatum TaxID=33114 RepID=A0A2G2VTT5_CAPBA|nr:UDP-glucuronic acid decarboxylase 1 [Capsicum baccatum]
MNHRRDEETTMSMMSQNTPPTSPKTLKHPRSLPRSINYILKEQRLLFILLGILIGSTFFILQPSLSGLTPSPGLGTVPEVKHASTVAIMDEFNGQGRGNVRGSVKGAVRVPVGIRRKRMRVVVTGGAGFVGSHLVDKLIKRGDDVIVIDNFFTGRKENVMHHFGNHRFELIRHDVVEPILLEVDQIYHLACPASPVHYKYNPVKTIISFSLH